MLARISFQTALLIPGDKVAKTYELIQLSERIGLQYSHLFLTRDKGQRAYRLLKAQLEKTPEAQALVLVFPPDQVVDASFGDETFVRLGREICAGYFGERCILLKGLTADSIKNINAVISLNQLKVPLLAIGPKRTWHIVGHLEDNLRDTLEIVAEKGRLLATDLMSIRRLAINTASTRLKRLHNLHLVRREYEITEKGLQYIYYFWNWTEE